VHDGDELMRYRERLPARSPTMTSQRSQARRPSALAVEPQWHV
jgi:hypothetical protein